MRVYPKITVKELRRLSDAGYNYVGVDAVNNSWVANKTKSGVKDYINTTWSPWKDRIVIHEVSWLLLAKPDNIVNKKVKS